MERMITWNYIVGGMSLFLLVFLVWKEAARVDRSLRAARIAAVVVLAFSLACLMLPVYFGRVRSVAPKGREGVLLTEGYDPDSLRQFMQAAKPGEMAVFSGERQLGYGSPDLAKLHVFGYGLSGEQWISLYPSSAGSPQVVFHSSPLRTGIISANWKQQLLPGERLRIQGTYYSADGKPVKLVLGGMNTPLDSIILFARGVAAGPAHGITTGPAHGIAADTVHGIAAGVQQEFELSTVPAQVGRAIYHITAGSAGKIEDTLEKESIPVEVLPGKALTILLLASAPGFENRFLVNWLSQNGHSVAMRTAISRGKYDKAYLNMAQVALDHLSTSLLDKFDVVVTDAEALRAMAPAELSCLRRQVEEKGMGLIIREDSLGSGFGVGIQALVRDSLSRILVSRNLYGSGKVVSSTLQNTYVKMLSGHSKEYASFWSLIIQKAARDTAPAGRWAFVPALPQVNEPVQVLLQTTDAGIPQGQFGANAVYLGQDALLPFLWRGTYWPGEAGWQSGHTLRGDTCWWYAWGPGDWQGLYRRQRWEDTRRLAAMDSAGSGHGSEAGPAVRRADLQGEGAGSDFIAKGWWYALLFLSCVFLWIEKKKLI
jgi:hypothetical protein